MSQRDQIDEVPVLITGVVRPSRWRRVMGISVALLCWLYLLSVIAVWLFLRVDGDLWWPATLVLFGPRWPLLSPLIPLMPLAIAFRRRWAWGLLILAILIAGPFMGFQIHRGRMFRTESPAGSLRVLTFNTHFVYVDAARLKTFIDATHPDIVSMQEWYTGNKEIVFPDHSWHTIELPEAILASHYPIERIGPSIGGSNIVLGVTYRYAIHFPDGVVTFYNVHLSSPHDALRNVMQRSPFGIPRLTNNSIERLREAMNLKGRSDDDTILAGDFNLPCDSTIYRSAFSEFHDAFSDAGLGYGFSYYSEWTILRIDHVLTGRNWRCKQCWVGPNLGSPHRPVIADLVRSNP